MSAWRTACRGVVGVLLALAAAVVPVVGQEMPDPSLIHGRALPARDLPDGTVTVRVVRESIGNDISGQPVTLTVGSTVKSATTDAEGRAEFTALGTGTGVATTTVDGELLTSQPFPVPATGGLRVILIAGLAKAAERKAAEDREAAAAPAVKGIVVLGGNSRVLMQFNNDNLEVYYVLEVENTARTRVDVGAPLVLTLPPEAEGAALLEESSRQASVNGRTVTITGPFAPGITSVQIGFRLMYSGGDATFSQTFPVPLQRVTVGVQKVGALQVASGQFSDVREVKPDGVNLYTLGTGAALQAGTPLTVRLSDLPHHSATPRWIAVGIAAAVLVAGVWLAISSRDDRAAGRSALESRREALLGQLVQLEERRRTGAVDGERYASRRERLTTELEQVYAALDEQGLGPKGGGEGVAA